MPRGSPNQWQVEDPRLNSRSLSAEMPALKKRLMQHWLEKASHLWSLDHDNNPMSFPIMEQLLEAESLVHTLQSVSAAYEFFYDTRQMHEAREERGKALSAIGRELRLQPTVTPQMYLTVYMLGVSSPWIDNSPSEFGQVHLMAAKSIVDSLLQQPTFINHPYRTFTVASFVWWDMSCSLLISPAEQTSLDAVELSNAVSSLQGKFCAITDHAIELVYQLGLLGRYCRCLYEGSIPDLVLEEAFESHLLSWKHTNGTEPIKSYNEILRLHGLIMLYRLCGRKTGSTIHTEAYIRDCVLSILQKVSIIPTDSPVFKFIHIPLFNAAAELKADDVFWRNEVLSWCAVLYSTNRSPTNKWALQLLESHWQFQDAGSSQTWLQVMLDKGWRLNLG